MPTVYMEACLLETLHHLNRVCVSKSGLTIYLVRTYTGTTSVKYINFVIVTEVTHLFFSGTECHHTVNGGYTT